MSNQQTTPNRPESIPRESRWNDVDNEWEYGVIDDNYRKQGRFKYWRKNGSLVNICNFENDIPHGSFVRYHENGEISQQGSFEKGLIVGERTFIRSKDTTSELFVGQTSEKVWKCVMTYEKGKVIQVKAYNKEGVEVTQWGEPIVPTIDFNEKEELHETSLSMPTQMTSEIDYNKIYQSEIEYKETKQSEIQHNEVNHSEIDYNKIYQSEVENNEFQPAESEAEPSELFQQEVFPIYPSKVITNQIDEVPSDGTLQEYYPSGTIKLTGQYKNGKKTGIWKMYAVSGFQTSQEEYVDGQKQGLFLEYDDNGNIQSGSRYENDEQHGQYYEIISSEQYPLKNAHYLTGNYEHGQKVGTICLLDKNRKVLRAYDRGVYTNLSDIFSSPIFSLEIKSPEEWARYKQTLLEENRIFETLLVAVRESANTNYLAPIYDFERYYCIPMSYDYAVGYANNLIEVQERLQQVYPSPESFALGCLSVFMQGILDGASVVPMLREQAIVFDQAGMSKIALDYIMTAQMLAPHRYILYYTSALIRMSLGDFDAAKKDVQQLAFDPELKVNQDYLNSYLLFFGNKPEFVPTTTDIQDYLPEKAEGKVAFKRSLEEIQNVVSTYVIRIMRVRKELIIRGVSLDSQWLCDDLNYLLPEKWQNWQNLREDQLNPEMLSPINSTFIPDLAKQIQRECSALSCLCYILNCDQILMPQRLDIRTGADKIVQLYIDYMSVVSDAYHQNAVPDVRYTYRGVKLTQMEPHLVHEDFGKEVRCVIDVLAWMGNQENVSPWDISTFMILQDEEEEVRQNTIPTANDIPTPIFETVDILGIAS